MKNIKLVLEYDGTNYHGYQVQPNGVTIQEILEKSIKILTNDEFILYCAGRTDAGVHAKGQVCNFKCEKLKVSIDELPIALNGILPKDISVKSAEYVDLDFNSRFSAKSREYIYKIYNSKYRSALKYKYSWFVGCGLNIKAMEEAMKYLVGTHDFKAFTCATYKDTTIRHINYINIERENEYINIIINANAFTRNMVRNIVGTLVEVGKGKRSIEEMQTILNSKDRQKAGICAPAHGLYFVKVEY